jgi:hypothetical protein
LTGVLLALWLAAPQPAHPGTEPRPERRPAQVDSLALSVADSFPLQVTVSLAGVLPDACTELEALLQRFDPESRTYRLELTSRRDPGAACAQVVSEYAISVPLLKAGLASGEFRVEAHDRTASFAIEPLGEFPGLDLPSAGPTEWFCALTPRLCFETPRDWSRSGLEWASPGYLSAVLGLRWRDTGESDPLRLLPAGSELHDQTVARLGASLGSRMTVSRDAGRLWSEHLFARCGDLWCELWLEAPSEALLDAAGESFWRLVRFATSY